MTLGHSMFGIAMAAAIAIGPAVSDAQTPASAAGGAPKYAPDVPAKITTPDTVETRIGTLRFKDGAPDRRRSSSPTIRSTSVAYQRVSHGMSATSVYAICRGLEEAGVKPNAASASLSSLWMPLAVPDAQHHYRLCPDVRQSEGRADGRASAPRALGPADDADFRWVVDVGLTDPTKERAGTIFSFLPATRKRAREGL